MSEVKIPKVVLDFVNSKACPTTLDSFHGNCGLDVEHVATQNVEDAYIDEYVVEKMLRIKELTGESKLFYMDKGAAAIRDYINNSNSTCVDQEYRCIDFDDFRVYTDYGIARYGWDAFITVSRVILPAKSVIKVEEKPRIYICSKDGESSYSPTDTTDFYMMPYLYYPKAIKPFLKWLKNKKYIKIKLGNLWNKNSSLEKKDDSYSWGKDSNDLFLYNFGSPMKNLKTIEDIEDYNQWITTGAIEELDKAIELEESKWKKQDLERFKSVGLRELHPIVLGITQEMVDEYVNYSNDRYQVFGK